MPPDYRVPPKKFLVAFSTPGERVEFVRSVAAEVERAVGAPNVFLGEWFEHYLAGDRADLKLDRIFVEQSTLVVTCVAATCAEGAWAKAELNAIGARVMAARGATDRERDAVLPIRIGDGDMEGINFSTLVPDVRNRSVEEVAQLILARLHLVEPESTAQWPEEPPSLAWSLANQEKVRTVFAGLLTRTTPHRCMFLQGPTESGKTFLTKLMIDHARVLEESACGRLDFKGTTDLDGAVGDFVRDLRVPEPPGTRLNERLGHVSESLRRRGRPTLVVLDGYDAAGTADEWVERHLLSTAISAKWLRVVVAGQRVPRHHGAPWEVVTAPPIRLTPPCAADWIEYGRKHRTDLTEADLEAAFRILNGKPSHLQQWLGQSI